MRIHFNWGLGVTLAYVVFAGSTLGFVAYAMSQPVDLVSPDYYSRSLQQDARTDAAARVLALGSGFACEVRPEARLVTFAVPVEQAASAAGPIPWYRPSSSSADRAEPFRVSEAGQGRISMDGLARGRWILQFEWQAQGRGFYAERPVTVP